MVKYYYKKADKIFRKKILRLFSLLVLFIGLVIVFYIFYPLVSWQIYFAPALASSKIQTPIPRSAVVNSSEIGSLISQAGNLLSGVDYTNAQNWFPGFNSSSKNQPKIPYYTISIPKLKINNATVSTRDNNLAIHLVNYQGTAVPPDNGNAVIFGHSTLPQLFNPNDYKTIFANAYQLKIGDKIYTSVNGVTYVYNIFNISVVEPSDTSIFQQDYDNSYLTLVTCTPPGTIWKRLILKAKLEKI
ncbi:MAG: sortase [Patescibacteria group bacterium]